MTRDGAVVIGASSGVGRALADRLARDGYDLVLAARSERDLAAIAADIEIQHGVCAAPMPLDLVAEDDQLGTWFSRCRAALPRIDVVLLPAGIAVAGDDGVSDWELTESIVATNFLAIVRAAQLFLADFETRDHGTLVFFSSIATAAPRRNNVAYTAAKSALESYARSLQHRFARSNVRVQLFALGYVDTAMARGPRLRLPVASSARVADAVVRGLHSGRRFRYLPRFWKPAVLLVGHLPWSIYRRLEF